MPDLASPFRYGSVAVCGSGQVIVDQGRIG
jgi:hypothetical protein